MLNFEMNDYCDVAEYREGEHERLQANEMFVDEHYVLMGILKRQFMKPQRAARMPTLVHSIDQISSGLYTVELSTLDDDFQIIDTLDAIVRNGYWQDSQNQLVFNGIPVQAAYFKGYYDDADRELWHVPRMLELPVRHNSPN